MQTNLSILNQLLETLRYDAVENGNQPLTIDYLNQLSNQPHHVTNAFLIPEIVNQLELIDGQDIQDRPDLIGTIKDQPNNQNMLYDFTDAKNGITDMLPYTLQEFINEILLMDLTLGSNN